MIQAATNMKEMSKKMMNERSAMNLWGSAFTKVRASTTILMGALALLMLPSIASAALMTLTFDDGAYDETIVYPGGELHGPYDWVESNGIRAEGFWAFDVGTPGAYFDQGHTHISDDFHGNGKERMHSWTNDIQGLYISLEDGQAFDIVSIDYSIRSRETTTDPFMVRQDWAWGPEDAQLLLSTSFDPTAAVLESQWTNVAVDDFGLPFFPWFTEDVSGVSGFTGINGFFLSHNVHYMEIDNIVLNVYDVVPIPEPSTALLVGLGLTALASRRENRASRKQA